MHQLVQIITAEIAAQGTIPFKRFMELALYCPEYGYYEKEKDNLGRQGDFYTSVSVGGLFGALLAARFAGWLDELRQFQSKVEPFTLVEAGAHHGELGLDILQWFRQFRPDLLANLRYLILEPSRFRQTIQAGRLAEFSSNLSWHTAIEPRSIEGIIFSNELLDAMPLTRLLWDASAQEWRELGVTVRGQDFAWERMGAAVLPWTVPEALLGALPDGFMVEFSQAASDWWRAAAVALRSGWLVTLDYGFEWEEFFDPGRRNGTLRTYREHRVGSDPLAAPGEQDLTAHVNFSELLDIGKSVGLTVERYERQAAFLGDIARAIIERQVPFPEWTPARLRQLRTLTHPDALGGSFRVLVQRRL